MRTADRVPRSSQVQTWKTKTQTRETTGEKSGKEKRSASSEKGMKSQEHGFGLLKPAAAWKLVVSWHSALCFVWPFTEPTPEEKLQKLHTDIKFALKVDNPVKNMHYLCEVFCCGQHEGWPFLCVFLLGHRQVSTSPCGAWGCACHQPDSSQKRWSHCHIKEGEIYHLVEQNYVD